MQNRKKATHTWRAATMVDWCRSGEATRSRDSVRWWNHWPIMTITAKVQKATVSMVKPRRGLMRGNRTSDRGLKTDNRGRVLITSRTHQTAGPVGRGARGRAAGRGGRGN